MPSRSRSKERSLKHERKTSKHERKSSKHRSSKRSHKTKNEENDPKPLQESETPQIDTEVTVEKRQHSPVKDEETAKRPVKVEEEAPPPPPPPATPSAEELRELRRLRLQAWRESQNLPEKNIVPETTENPEDVPNPDPSPAVEENEDEVDPLDAYMEALQKDIWNSRIVKGADGVISSVVQKSNKKWKKDNGYLMESTENDFEYLKAEDDEDLEDTLRKFKCKKEKVIAIDHNSMEYQPYRKSFYKPVPEIAEMSAEQVATFKRQLDDIKVKGKNAPRPIKTWAQTGLPLKLLDALKKCNFHTPTPIQAQAIVTILSGLNMIGIAKTGSGKTLAFGLPLIRHVLDQDVLQPGDGPIGVIMTPTRELCIQVTRDIRKFARLFSITVTCIYGGTAISDQIAELKRGCEIVVCTPGRMIDMLAANNGRVTNLRRVTFIVIDEADRMFDMGFEPQVMRIVDNTRPDKQVALFSATFPRPMEALARHILKQPIEIQIGARNVVCSDVEQHVIVLDEQKKILKLLELLGIYGERGSTLVFVDTQEHADDLLKRLLRHSYPCMALHGGVDQYDRDSIFRDFKHGDIRLLISTSLAARGLDVRDLIVVINYDCPNHYEDYVHRCGRTGRAGNKGYAFTFITPDQEKSSVELIEALRLAHSDIPPDLEAMAEAYLLRISEEGKKMNRHNGFGGRGFKFNEVESVNYVNEQRAMFGFVSDQVDVGDADENAKEIENQINKVLNGESDGSRLTVSARKEANRSKIEKACGYAQPQEDIITLRTRAEEIVELFHEKLGYVPSPNIYSMEAEKYQRYDTELDINEFPRPVRMKVTSRDVISQIEEYSCGATISVCGTFVERGKKSVDGEKKLYLSIAGLSQVSLDRAKRELIRIIKEEMVDMEGSARYQQIGRYVV